MLPPRPVRRVVVLPAFIVLALVLILSYPVTALVAAALSLVWPPPRLPSWPPPWPPRIPDLRTWFTRSRRPQWRVLRILTLLVACLAAELLALLRLGRLWLAAGFGRDVRTPEFERRHYQLVRNLLGTIFTVAERLLRVRIQVEGPSPDDYRDRPLLVFCRHAGPGDSFLIVHALLSWYDRDPRIVLKDTMQWDPAIDVVLNRLPARFIRSGAPGESTKGDPDVVRPVDAIGELATRLDGNDALVLFPEGGNFTDRRRARAIQRLRRKGLMAEVAKAEAMRNVLPPRPAGVVAALRAQQLTSDPADVVWVAHTGTDHLFSVADIWRALPMDTDLRMRWWHVPAAEIPADEEEQIQWLFRWWQEIDGWIGDNRPA